MASADWETIAQSCRSFLPPALLSVNFGPRLPLSWGRFFNRGPFIEPLDFWLRLIFWAEGFGGREWLLLQEFFPVRFRILTLKSMLSSNLCFFAQPDYWCRCW